MNRKGQMDAFGYILVAFMAIIVGVVLFQVIAQEVGRSTNTIAVENETVGVMTNYTVINLTSYRSCSGVIIFNATNDVPIPADNYTIVNNALDANGNLLVSIFPITECSESGYCKGTATIDGTCQPLTYIPDSGGRAMAALIVVFFALAVAVVALEPTLRSGVLNLMGK